MAILLAATGTAADKTVAGANLDVPYPAGIAANDVLVLYVASTVAITAQSGWTAISVGGAVLTVTGGQMMAVYKLATGSESGNLTVTIASGTHHGRMFRYSGVDTTTPLDVAGTNVGLNQAAISITSITTVTADAMVMAFGCHVSAAITYTQTSGTPTMVERDDAAQAGGAGRSGCHYSEIKAAAGATGTVTLTGSASARCIGVIGALRPAPPAPALPIIVMPPRRH